MPSSSTAGCQYTRRRQLPVGPGGLGKPNLMMLKMPPGQSGTASGPSDGHGKLSPSAQACSGLGTRQEQCREENKPQISREKDETHGITHLPMLLLLFLGKAAKRKSESTK